MTEQLPIPLSRADCYLATAAGMTGVVLPANGPQSREEDYLAYMAGDTTIVLPTPGPLKEQWLAIICGDTSVTTPEIKGAFLIGQQMVRVEFLAKAAGIDGVVLPTDPNRTEQYFANIGGIVPDPGVLTQAKGTYIVLNNVLRGIDSLNYIYGDTYQQTYSGKNLLDVTTLAKGSIAVVDGIVTGTAAQFNSAFGTNTDGIITGLTGQIAISATAYTDGNASTTNVNGLKINIVYTDSTSESIAWNNSQITPLGKSIVSNASKIINKITISYSNAGSNIWHISNFQIESGSSATAYEPYVGGVPSPSPSYPQDIQVVTGEQTVNVHGKNLFDKDNPNILNAYVDSSVSVITANANNRTIWIPCKPNTTYTIQKLPITSDYRRSIGYTTQLPAIGVQFYGEVHGTNGWSSLSITTGNDAKYLVARVWVSNQDSTTLEQMLNSIQIEQGSTATTYEPYQSQNYPISLGSTELCKIGDYQDKLFKNEPSSDYYNPSLDEGAWYVHKEIGIHTFSDSDNWRMPNSSSYPHLFQADNISGLDLASTYTSDNLGVGALCYALTFRYSTDVRSNEGFAMYHSGSSQYVRICNNSLSSTTDLSNWLSNGNVKAYYALSTPTDTKITDSTLISQLEALDSATLPTPDAFIQVTGNLAGEIEISYYAKSE